MLYYFIILYHSFHSCFLSSAKIQIFGNIQKNCQLFEETFPSPSRCSAPIEAFVLWPSVLRATIPLRPRFVPLCGLRSINASPRCRPLRLLASLRWLHIVFVPPASQGLLLPFAATVAHRRCQRKRTPSALTKVCALTTTFRYSV